MSEVQETGPTITGVRPGPDIPVLSRSAIGCYDLARIRKNLEGLARSGLTLSRIPAAYEQRYGCKLDYRRMGFESLERFIRIFDTLCVENHRTERGTLELTVVLAERTARQPECADAFDPVEIKTDLTEEEKKYGTDLLLQNLRVIHLERYQPLVICCRCRRFVFAPVLLMCDHLMCRECWRMLSSENDMTCQFCDIEIVANEVVDVMKLDTFQDEAPIQRVLDMFKRALFNRKACCIWHLKGCNFRGTIGNLVGHVMVCTHAGHLPKRPVELDLGTNGESSTGRFNKQQAEDPLDTRMLRKLMDATRTEYKELMRLGVTPSPGDTAAAVWLPPDPVCSPSRGNSLLREERGARWSPATGKMEEDVEGHEGSASGIAAAAQPFDSSVSAEGSSLERHKAQRGAGEVASTQSFAGRAVRAQRSSYGEDVADISSGSTENGSRQQTRRLSSKRHRGQNLHRDGLLESENNNDGPTVHPSRESAGSHRSNSRDAIHVPSQSSSGRLRNQPQKRQSSNNERNTESQRRPHQRMTDKTVEERQTEGIGSKAAESIADENAARVLGNAARLDIRADEVDAVEAGEDDAKLLDVKSCQLEIADLEFPSLSLTCVSCGLLAIYPTLLPCKHIFCEDCLIDRCTAQTREAGDNVCCDFCGHLVMVDWIRMLDPGTNSAEMLANFWRNIQLKCRFGCGWTGTLDDWLTHQTACRPRSSAYRGSSAPLRTKSARQNTKEQLYKQQKSLWAEILRSLTTVVRLDGRQLQGHWFEKNIVGQPNGGLLLKPLGRRKIYADFFPTIEIQSINGQAGPWAMEVGAGEKVLLLSHPANQLFGYCLVVNDQRKLGWIPTACLKPPQMTRTEFIATLRHFRWSYDATN